MKRIILIITLMSLGLVTHAQDFVDNALLFSRTRPAGSARIQGIGGAQVSLGGDYSSALSNPAGLGMFNRSEFTFSTALTFSNASSDYFGTNTKDSKTVFNVPGLSLAVHFPSKNDQGFLGGTLGITLSRVNDFNMNARFSGENDDNSIVDYFIQDAGDTDPDLFLDDSENAFYSLTGLAYRNYLIEDFVDAQGVYYNSVLTYDQSRQEEVSERKGAQYQWSIAYGANFSDKFFAGATLGIATLRFKLNQMYREDDFRYPQGEYPALNDLNIDESYDISGSGVNFTLGAIYRPVNFLQVGASFSTPTYYQITDNYTARVETNWNNYDYYPDDTQDANLNDIYETFDQPLISEYNLSTPMKFSTGATFINKFGFISGDVEFVNYSKARYTSDIADDFGPENDAIKAEYKKAINYRVGAEFRYDKFRVRGGFNYMSNPLISEITSKSQTGYTGGLGYRDKNFYIDFAATLMQFTATRVPYFVSGSPDPAADQKFRMTNFMVTVGFPF